MGYSAEYVSRHLITTSWNLLMISYSTNPLKNHEFSRSLYHGILKHPASLSPFLLSFLFFSLILPPSHLVDISPSQALTRCFPALVPLEDVRGSLLSASLVPAKVTTFDHRLLNPWLLVEHGLCGSMAPDNIPPCSVDTVPLPLSLFLRTISPHPSCGKCPVICGSREQLRVSVF